MGTVGIKNQCLLDRAEPGVSAAAKSPQTNKALMGSWEAGNTPTKAKHIARPPSCSSLKNIVKNVHLICQNAGPGVIASAMSIKEHYCRYMRKKSECWTMSRSNSHMSHMAIKEAGDKPPTIAKHCEAPQVSILNEHKCTEKAGAKARVARKLPQIAPASLN